MFFGKKKDDVGDTVFQEQTINIQDIIDPSFIGIT